MDVYPNIALARLHHADRIAAAESARRAKLARASRRRDGEWLRRRGIALTDRTAAAASGQPVAAAHLNFGR